jgi:hypothetical protein
MTLSPANLRALKVLQSPSREFFELAPLAGVGHLDHDDAEAPKLLPDRRIEQVIRALRVSGDSSNLAYP